MLPPVDRLQSCRGCHLSDCHSVVQLSCCRVAGASERWRDAAVGRPSSTSSLPRKRSGARSRSREWCRSENRCDRDRMLPEYFTDDPVVVKTVVIRGLAIKSHAGVARRRRPRPEPVAIPLYSPLFLVSDSSLSANTAHRGLPFKRRPPFFRVARETRRTSSPSIPRVEISIRPEVTSPTILYKNSIAKILLSYERTYVQFWYGCCHRFFPFCQA